MFHRPSFLAARVTWPLWMIFLASAGPVGAAPLDPWSGVQARPSVAPVVARSVEASAMWARVTGLLRLNREPSRAEFEAALGPVMRESLLDGDATFYAVNQGASRFFDVSFNLDRSSGTYRLRVAQPLVDRGSCVSPAQFSGELAAAGWRAGQSDPEVARVFTFTRRSGADQIFLYVTDGCLDRVSVSMGKSLKVGGRVQPLFSSHGLTVSPPLWKPRIHETHQ